MYAVQRWGYGTVSLSARPSDSESVDIAYQVARVSTQEEAVQIAAKTFGLHPSQLLKRKAPEPAVMSGPRLSPSSEPAMNHCETRCQAWQQPRWREF